MKRGFTLIELLVVVAILAIIVAILIPSAPTPVRTDLIEGSFVNCARNFGMDIRDKKSFEQASNELRSLMPARLNDYEIYINPSQAAWDAFDCFKEIPGDEAAKLDTFVAVLRSKSKKDPNVYLMKWTGWSAVAQLTEQELQTEAPWLPRAIKISK